MHNIIFAKAGVLFFHESTVQGSSLVFQMNICAKIPRLHKYEKRYPQPNIISAIKNENKLTVEIPEALKY